MRLRLLSNYLHVSAPPPQNQRPKTRQTVRNKKARVENDSGTGERENKVDEKKIAEMLAEKLAAHTLPLLVKTLEPPQLLSRSGAPAHSSNGTMSRVNTVGSSGGHQVEIEEVELSPPSSSAERTPPKRKATHFDSYQAADLRCILEQQAEIQKVHTHVG